LLIVKTGHHLGLVPTIVRLPSREWVVYLLGDERVYARDTGANLLHFAREPRHRVLEAHMLGLLYDSGSTQRPRVRVPVATWPSGE
jgi:hypothetical protein